MKTKLAVAIAVATLSMSVVAHAGNVVQVAAVPAESLDAQKLAMVKQSAMTAGMKMKAGAPMVFAASKKDVQTKAIKFDDGTSGFGPEKWGAVAGPYSYLRANNLLPSGCTVRTEYSFFFDQAPNGNSGDIFWSKMRILSPGCFRPIVFADTNAVTAFTAKYNGQATNVNGLVYNWPALLTEELPAQV